LLLCAAAVLAQAPDSVALRGRIVDQTDAVLSGVAAKLTVPETGLRRTAVSNYAGQSTFGQLPLATAYRLRFGKSSFAGREVSIGAIRVGETATVDAIPAPETSRTAVTVFGTLDGIQSDLPELGTRLDESAVDHLPMLGRKLTTLALFDSSSRPARGTGDLFMNNTLFVMNGAGRRQTAHVIDGSTGDDAWVRQTVFTNVSLTAVREFTILANSFSAEYGWNAGTAININTISGANAIHGDALFLWRSAGPQARPPLGAPGTSDRLNQFSGSWSGPVIRNRTHFLIAGEFSRQDRDSTVTSPLEPGVYVGHYRQELGLIRLDHQFSDAHSVAFRLGSDTFEDTNPQDAVGGLTLPSAAAYSGAEATRPKSPIL
jgi:hypothetical protein